MDINHLLEDIYIRHACKNVDKYLADIKNSVGIKLVPSNRHSLEFTWSKDFKWYSDVTDERDIILDYFKWRKPKMFSIEDYGLRLSTPYTLYFKFKLHPENAV